jgi:hypothetical protein
MTLEIFEGLPILSVSVTVHNRARAKHPGGVWELGDGGSLTVRDVSIRLALKSAPARSAFGIRRLQTWLGAAREAMNGLADLPISLLERSSCTQSGRARAQRGD